MGASHRIAFAAVVFALLGPAAPSSATVMSEVPLEDMIRDADAIVHAVVERTGVQTEIGDQGARPHTVTVLRVKAWLGGQDHGDRVTVRELGGQWRGGGQWIAGTPRYRTGEEVVVFLRRDPRTSAFRTYGMAQGKFVVRHGAPGVPKHVRRDLSEIAYAAWSEGRMTVTHGAAGPAIQLAELLALIDEVRGWLVHDGPTGTLEVRR